MNPAAKLATCYSKTYANGSRRVAPEMHVTVDGKRSLCGLEVGAVSETAPREGNCGCNRCWRIASK